MKSELRPLTGLRFIAALYVFLFHCQIRWPYLSSSYPANFMEVGAVGMSLFFMLSGYVLAYRYDGAPIQLKNYYINRLARIYPVYAVAALVTLPWIGLTIITGHGPGQFLFSVTKMSALVFANATLLQAWVPRWFYYWNDSGSWSISAEAFFYVLFPFIFMAVSRRSSRELKWLIGGTYALAVIPGLVDYLSNSASAEFYSVPIFRLPEFVLGVCTYFLVKLHPRVITPARLATVLVLLPAYLGIAGISHSMFVSNNWIVVPAFGFIIAYAANTHGMFAKLLSIKPIVWAGKVSYCFYSFQALVLFYLMRNHDSLVVQFPMLRNNLILTAAAFVTLLLLSALGYHFIEEPMRRWIMTRGKKAKPLVQPSLEAPAQ